MLAKCTRWCDSDSDAFNLWADKKGTLQWWINNFSQVDEGEMLHLCTRSLLVQKL